MLKHLVHSHHTKLHTFDDFYNNNTKTIKSRSSSSNDLILTTNNYSSPSPTSPCSPNSNPYTFYNVFSDFKSITTPAVVIEEDETEDDNQRNPSEPQSPAPVFYLEDDHHHQQQQQHSQSSSSPHWPTLILNRFRHSNPNHGIIKQVSVNENQLNSTKIRKNEHSDSSINKHRYLKRSETINNTNGLFDKKSSNDDFPELSLPSTNNVVKKHRSFVSLFHHFHHHHHHHENLPSTNDSNKSKSTGTLDTEILQTTNEISRPKLIKQKTLPLNNEINSPMKKSPSSPILPKLVSFFHLHHSSEHHKYRVGNLKARLHHRRHSPPLTNTAPKFRCQLSNELIQQIQQLEEERSNQNAYIQLQRSAKPVVMKRVHTWHNTCDLRPLDQCLEY
jgi:hypothetical protein